MKVVLLNPPNVDEKSYMARSADRWPHRVPVGSLFKGNVFPKYPLYLAYSAAVLEKSGFDVTIIDAAKKNYSINKVKDMISKINPNLVVIEISTPSLNTDLQTAEAIKNNGDYHITLIGPDATMFALDLVSNPFVDSVMKGEYFYTLRDLSKSIEDGTGFDKIKGLIFKNNGNIVENPERPLIEDIDELPYPARHLLDPNEYLMGHYTYKPQFLMITSMGCPYKCIFCIWPKVLYKGRIRLRSPQKVVEEMKYLKKMYKLREIYFDDDLFNISEKRVFDICDAIIDAGIKIPWITEMRVDKVSKEMLKRMKEAGCIKILYGVESSSQKILDNANKGITTDQIRRALKLTKEAGIKIHASFMFGLPGETKETIRRTKEFAKELGPDTIQCSLAVPYPGTEFYKIAKENGSLKIDNWLDFDGELMGVIEYPGLSKEYMREEKSKIYKEFYMRPSYLAQQVSKIRSPSDLKRLMNLAKGYFRRYIKF